MTKYLILLVLSISSLTVFLQKIDYNLDGGFIAEGYDVVSYFNNSPEKGNAKFIYNYKDVKLKFTNQANLDLFKGNPDKYFPQYGGWCAYAIGAKSEKVSINPKTYEIRNGKLYLFYNSWGTNTLKLWLDENPNKLVKKADINWEKLKFKK